MTSPEILRAKAIAAILEAADLDDAKDAEQALRLIRQLLETPAKP